VPPPPQVAGEVQVPHELTVRDVPQLSLAVTLPQLSPSRVQNAVVLSGVQAPVVVTVTAPSVGSMLMIQLLLPSFNTCSEFPPCVAVSVADELLTLTLTTVWYVTHAAAPGLANVSVLPVSCGLPQSPCRTCLYLIASVGFATQSCPASRLLLM
jgi:hypothetical protein